MPLTEKDVLEEVLTHIGVKSFRSFYFYVKGKEVDLWGCEQPYNFLGMNVTLFFYKGMTGYGYQKILKTVELSFDFNHKTFQHNCEVLRLLGEKWAERHIEWGTKEEWDEAAKDVKRKGALKEVNLWADSFDLPMTNPKGWSKRDLDFSYKLNRYGQRYMAFQNRLRQICWIGGGYSPKMYDGHYIHSVCREIRRNLKGGVVVADSHFRKAEAGMKEVQFKTPFPKPAIQKGWRAGAGVAKLDRAKQVYNRRQKALRARVESTFGIIHGIFPSLKQPWREDKVGMDCMVMIAAAIHNLKNM
jgi:hypothetical protein